MADGDFGCDAVTSPGEAETGRKETVLTALKEKWQWLQITEEWGQFYCVGYKEKSYNKRHQEEERQDVKPLLTELA